MEQGALIFKKNQEDVSDAAVTRCKDFRAALRLCIETSGIPLKEAAFAVGIQENHLSRMISPDGDRHFPPELIPKLMDVAGNEIPLRWLAQSRNYGLYRLKSAQDLIIERLERENQEKDRKIALMMEIVKEIRS